MDKAAWNRYGKQGYNHYDVSQVGYKYNLMDLLSVIGIIQLKKINKHLKKRQKIFNSYSTHFKKLSFMMPDKWDTKIMQHSYHLFNIFLDKKRDGISRDEAILKLHKKKLVLVYIIEQYLSTQSIKNCLIGKLMTFQMLKI